MRLTLLGTGGPMPGPRRVQAGYLVETPERTLLVDCGSGVLHRLARTESGYTGIDAVVLTHHHLDHVADLLSLLKARWLADAPELPVVGPPGTAELVDGLLGLHEYLDGKVAVAPRDIERDVTEIEGWDVRAMETAHSMQCFAYRLEGEAGDLVLSGDTEAMDALGAFADGSAVLVHDCSFPDSVDVSNHPTPRQLGASLAGRDIGRVYLSHLYPHTEGRHEEMIASITSQVSGDVEILPDLTTIEV